MAILEYRIFWNLTLGLTCENFSFFLLKIILLKSLICILKIYSTKIWGKHRKRWCRKSRKSLCFFFPSPLLPRPISSLSHPLPVLRTVLVPLPSYPGLHRDEPRPCVGSTLGSLHPGERSPSSLEERSAAREKESTSHPSKVTSVFAPVLYLVLKCSLRQKHECREIN